jgi:hypothetical protein
MVQVAANSGWIDEVQCHTNKRAAIKAARDDRKFYNAIRVIAVDHVSPFNRDTSKDEQVILFVGDKP